MATADAIADLGDTLVALLAQKLAGMVNAGDIKIATPDDLKSFAPTRPSVSIFLYHISVNAEMRNGPRRGATKPPLPLELRFLITPWAVHPRDTYRMVGAITQIFHDHAVLKHNELMGDSWLADDTVEIVMESLPVEQHYDIWDSTEIPYRLSLTYLVRVIGIDSAIPAGGTPVTTLTIQQVAP